MYFFKYSCAMFNVLKFKAFDRHFVLFVTCPDYEPKTRIRLIEQKLDVGSH